jgi:hypothetical protein
MGTKLGFSVRTYIEGLRKDPAEVFLREVREAKISDRQSQFIGNN